MNREIKFRGLRFDGKVWVYGHYYQYNNKSYIGFQDLTDNAETGYNHEVIPESVGQFTGLKDKNGVDIYEGDIFTADFYPFKDDGIANYNGVIEWIYAGFQYTLRCVNPNKRGISEGINEILEEGGWMKIIGNIHQNPELI